MAGIFPENGVVAGRTINGEDPVNATCEALYYRAVCNPRFDPVAMNALISEIVNAVNFYKEYDCAELDNLRDTLEWIRNLCNLPRANLNELTDTASFAGCFGNGPKRLTWGDFKTKVLPCFFPLVTNNAVIMAGSFAGCFNGDSGRVTFTKLKELLSSESTPYSICSLPRVALASVNLTADSLGGCFANTDKRIVISDLLGLLANKVEFSPTASTQQAAENTWNVIEIDTAQIQYPKAVKIGGRNGTMAFQGGGTVVSRPPETLWGQSGIGMSFFNSESGANNMSGAAAHGIMPASFTGTYGSLSLWGCYLTMLPGRDFVYVMNGIGEFVTVFNPTGSLFWVIPRVDVPAANGSPKRVTQWTRQYGAFQPR